MPYNSILADYRAHQAALAAGGGGESAEAPAIRQALAEMLLAVVGELPLQPPLTNATAQPTPLSPPWPNLRVLPSDAGWETKSLFTGQLPNSPLVFHPGGGLLIRYHFRVWLFGGPETAAPEVVAALLEPYLDPLVRAITANQSLNRAVKSLGLEGPGGWGLQPYGGHQWAGLYLPVVAVAQTTMRSS